MLIDRDDNIIPLTIKANLLSISRSTIYYKPVSDPYDDILMRLIDEIYTKTPFYGSRRITHMLKRMGHDVGRRRVIRLMDIMGISAIYPEKHTSIPNHDNVIYPYLLKDVPITFINQVWGTDITYIRLTKGFVYLMAIMDWYSRYVYHGRYQQPLIQNFDCIGHSPLVNPIYSIQTRGHNLQVKTLQIYYLPVASG